MRWRVKLQWKPLKTWVLSYVSQTITLKKKIQPYARARTYTHMYNNIQYLYTPIIFIYVYNIIALEEIIQIGRR